MDNDDNPLAVAALGGNANQEEGRISPLVEMADNAQNIPPADEERDRRAFRTLIWSIVMFFEPLYINIKESNPAMTIMFDYFESVWDDWKAWYDRTGVYARRPGENDETDSFNNFWEITWLQFMTKARQSRTNVIAYIRDGRRSLELCFRIWFESYTMLRESLKDLKDLHNYIAPQIEGVDPVWVIPDSLYDDISISLRDMCFRMNVNLMRRMFHFDCKFLSHTMNFFPPTAGANQNLNLREPPGDGGDGPGDGPGGAGAGGAGPGAGGVVPGAGRVSSGTLPPQNTPGRSSSGNMQSQVRSPRNVQRSSRTPTKEAKQSRKSTDKKSEKPDWKNY